MEQIKQTENSQKMEKYFFKKEDIDILFQTFKNPADIYSAVQKYINDICVNELGELLEVDIGILLPYIRKKVTEHFPENEEVLGKFDYLLVNLNTAFSYEKANLNKQNKSWTA